MAKDQTDTLTPGEWNELTANDVTNITFQNLSQYDMWVLATTASAPTGPKTDGKLWGPGTGEKNAALSDLWPGITGADRVFAYADHAIQVSVSHA